MLQAGAQARHARPQHAARPGPCSAAARRAQEDRSALRVRPRARARDDASSPSFSPSSRKVLLCGLRTLVDMSAYEARCSLEVAKELWPDIVVGPETLYVQYLSRMWGAVSSLEDGPMLARVLAEEGVIGALRACRAPSASSHR